MEHSAPRWAPVDIDYPATGGANAAAVFTADPHFVRITDERISRLAEVEPYRPGAFWTRELPALRAVLADAATVDLLVVDGYVDLDPYGRPGLGAHAHDAFGVPVIGVAKTPFHSATHAYPVLRGAATRPLYVTAAGLSVADAAELVRTMAGPYRLPDALRRVDALARGRVHPAAGPQPGPVERG